MRITEIDLQCDDIMWFAIDNNGYIISFTSGGEGNVPEFVCRSKEETETLESFFMNLPTGLSNAVLVIDKDGSALSTDAEALSQKGIFCFDVCSDPDFEYGYYKISFPEKKLHLSDLPADIQSIISDHIIDIDVSAADRIMVENAY